MSSKKIILKIYFPTLVLIFILLGVLYLIYKEMPNTNSPVSPSATIPLAVSHTPELTPTLTPTLVPTATQNPNSLADPIADFKPRVTKKPFGLYITPQNSPISPEKFTGYHTGADVEYQDVTSDVPVYSLADGKIVLSRNASGYGGVMIIEFTLGGIKHSALYGHIRPSSFVSVGTGVSKGEQIGLLGTGYSAETDGERRHLHFAMLSDNRIDLLGYVQNKSELSGWLDPLSLY